MFKALKDGARCGVTDGAPPEAYTERDLSDAHDAFVTLCRVFGEDVANKFWFLLPNSFRVDYNWSKWKYRVKRV